MKLVSIRPAKHEGLYVFTVDDDGVRKRYTLPDSVYEEMDCPAVGSELTPDAYAILREAGYARDALVRALSILSYGDKSHRALVERLIQKGVPYRYAEEAAREAVRLGYINEERQLRNIIPILANQKLHGARRIIPELVNKGYQSGQIRTILSHLVEEGEINFQENFERLLEKTKTDPRDKEARIALAYRYGYRS